MTGLESLKGSEGRPRGRWGPRREGKRRHVGKIKSSSGKTQNKRTDQVRGRAVQSKLGVSWVPSQLPLGYSLAACCSFCDHSIASCDCNNSTDPSASYFRACCHSQLNISDQDKGSHQQNGGVATLTGGDVQGVNSRVRKEECRLTWPAILAAYTSRSMSCSDATVVWQPATSCASTANALRPASTASWYLRILAK